MTNSSRPSASDHIVDILAGLPLFSALTEEMRVAIAPSFFRRAYDRDDVLFFEGEPPEWIHVLVDGHVKLVKHSDDGREVILDIAMPGDMMGGVSAFGRRPHPFTAQAMVPTTTLRAAGTDFASIMQRHPTVASSTMDELIEELVEAHEKMKSLATERVERRIARELLKLAKKAGRVVEGGVEIVVPLSRQDVADIAGTTVETAIRVLSRWRTQRRVATVAGRLVIINAHALRVIAEDELPTTDSL